jgi:hypothetical protein
MNKLLLFSLFLCSSNFLMALSQTKFPSTCVNDTGALTDWTNPSNGTLEDGVVARVTAATSNILKCTGYNFSIPLRATITGIKLETKKRADSGAIVIDLNVRLYKAGVLSGDEKADTGTNWNDTALTYSSYGSDIDLWGTSWTPSDINDSNFGSGLAGQKNTGGSNPFDADVERVTVYFTGATTIEKGTIYKATFR